MEEDVVKFNPGISRVNGSKTRQDTPAHRQETNQAWVTARQGESFEALSGHETTFARGGTNKVGQGGEPAKARFYGLESALKGGRSSLDRKLSHGRSMHRRSECRSRSIVHLCPRQIKSRIISEEA